MRNDFRAVRTMVFGQAETRQMADFRRSGSVEALEGEAPPEKLSSKMANTLSASNRLHKTYGPVMLAAVRDADAARRRGPHETARAKRTDWGRKCHSPAPESVTGRR